MTEQTIQERDEMNTPKKFQKKPVTIEAMQLIGTSGDAADVIYWLAAGVPLRRPQKPLWRRLRRLRTN